MIACRAVGYECDQVPEVGKAPPQDDSATFRVAVPLRGCIWSDFKKGKHQKRAYGLTQSSDGPRNKKPHPLSEFPQIHAHQNSRNSCSLIMPSLSRSNSATMSSSSASPISMPRDLGNQARGKGWGGPAGKKSGACLAPPPPSGGMYPDVIGMTAS